MASKEKIQDFDSSTESKIKDTARAVFLRKGYSATRTRDITAEAGINLALLNYYFRSKENLFGIIMYETMSEFLQNMSLVFNNEETTLQEKVESMAEKFIDKIIGNPDVPLFIMSELRNDISGFLEKLPVPTMILNSSFIRQHQAAVALGQIKEPNPLHFVMNLMSLIMFPFIASPLLKKIGNLDESDFDKLMLDRKNMIPAWIQSMFH